MEIKITRFVRYLFGLSSIIICASCFSPPSIKRDNPIPSPRKPNASARTAVNKTAVVRTARVVIDPGHGGKDSGAIGHRGLKEKDVTLDIALRLQRLFRRYLPQVDVALTRSSDRYVALEQRIGIAQEKKGDVFVSLHINSSESKSASGFEVFSLDIASDRHSERLAARENLDSGRQSDNLGFILADLRSFSNRSESDHLAALISGGLKSQLSKDSARQLRDRGYNQAIFHVLFVKMPAVLTELFFISNPKEEKILSEKSTRELIARGLFLGIKKFLDHRNTRGSYASG